MPLLEPVGVHLLEDLDIQQIITNFHVGIGCLGDQIKLVAFLDLLR